jgi:endoglucanase Acf2
MKMFTAPHAALMVATVMGLAALPALAQPVKVGAGAYQAQPQGDDKSPPAAPHRTEAMLKRAAPTNQWYSTLIFSATPEPIYAQPITVRTTAKGLEFSLPAREVIATERQDTEIHYVHKNPLLIAPTAFEPGSAKLAGASDWAIDISMANGGDDLRSTVAHGSPYAYLRLTRGDLRVTLPSAGTRLDNSADARVVALRVGTQSYALFGPTGVRWEQASPTEWLARMPAGASYASVAALPDDKAESLALLARHAYAFVENTRVDWAFDKDKSQVSTQFKATTRAMEGSETRPLLGLYPHHWYNNASVQAQLGPVFDTVRGPIKLLASDSFSTTASYASFVPWWPAVDAGERKDQLADVMKIDVRNARRMMLEIGKGPYWQGKGLQRITKLMDVTDVQGDKAASERLMKLLKGRVEDWFSGEDSKTYFHLDKTLGTVVAYPEEYFSVEQMNDHHFHYGYWIRTVAELGLRDPAWASKAQWGGMVDLLVSDIAHPVRGDTSFPFLRNFDPYEGHSWASGLGLGEWGNNQESSSEAMNAWAGLILWGELNGDTALRDLGVWLYTTEAEAIQHYWFDIHGLVFAPEYKNVEVSMVFGGKYAHNTWWTDEPRQIKGINLLPVSTASTYMARDKAFIQKSVGTLEEDTRIYLSRGKGYNDIPKDIWQDVFLKYLALADPVKALNDWERWGSVELGETRAHTLHWLLSLNQMGTPDPTVTANTTLYAVFKRPDGLKTYLVHNAGKSAQEVRFSDGKTLTAAPGQLTRASSAP